MKTRHAVTGVAAAASALALVPVAQASAHDGTTPGVTGSAVTDRARLAALGTLALDQLDAWSTRLKAATAAVSAGTVLTGRTRDVARRQLAAAVGTYTRLGTLTGLTAAQQTRIDLIQSRLAAAAANLRALLANRPALPVTVVPTTTTAVTPTSAKATSTRRVAATEARQRCDGTRLGDRDGSRLGGRDGSRLGDRDGSRWRHHDGSRR